VLVVDVRVGAALPWPVARARHRDVVADRDQRNLAVLPVGDHLSLAGSDEDVLLRERAWRHQRGSERKLSTLIAASS
jgi:hypothetical protein